MKIKKGDNIIVIAGKDRGKSGSVLRAFPKKEQVLIEGVNVITRHQKARRRGQQGQIVKKPSPIHVSNIAIKDKKSNKPARVGYTVSGEGEKARKIRVTRPTGEKV